MKQTNTELTFTAAELITAIEKDIAEAHYRRLAAERMAARQQRSLQELRELIDGSGGDYPGSWDYAAATFAFAVALLVFLFFKLGALCIDYVLHFSFYFSPSHSSPPYSTSVRRK